MTIKKRVGLDLSLNRKPRHYAICNSIPESSFKDDEFKCVRRIAAELGLSMPESDEEVLTYSTFRKIERALKQINTTQLFRDNNE